MGLISTFTDATGTMTDTEVNAQNIDDIIEELNRNSDQLDSLSNNMSISTQSSTSFQWNGSPQAIGVESPLDVDINTFYAFYTRSDMPNNLYTIPDYQFTSAGALIYAVTIFVGGEDGGINPTFTFVQSGTPATYTVYFFILNQPVTTSGL